MFKLLQHRVGQTGDKRVAAQHQHRQPVGVGKRRSGQEVGSARPGRCSAKHEPPPQMILCIGRCRKAHGLLILAAIKRKFIADFIQCLAKARDVAMTENPESAATNACFNAIHNDKLVHQVSNNRLGDR